MSNPNINRFGLFNEHCIDIMLNRVARNNTLLDFLIHPVRDVRDVLNSYREVNLSEKMLLEPPLFMLNLSSQFCHMIL